VELENLKIKTRLTNEKFARVKGECDQSPEKKRRDEKKKILASFWTFLT
jgi:hypothetical protein